jgi:hypothetical protein
MCRAFAKNVAAVAFAESNKAFNEQQEFQQQEFHLV